MRVGVMLPVFGRWQAALDLARHAEEVGADSVWVADHLQGMPVDRPILESWTTLTAVAASTERVEVGQQVLCQSFRNPALLAKMAATLDNVSGGRFRFVVGAGWYQQEYEAFGWDFPPPGMRVDQLRDYVRILKGMLSGSEQPFTYDGKHYSVKDAVNLPQPVRCPMPVEVGGTGDRMLRLVAREADGWSIAGLGLGIYDECLAKLAKACAEAGRRLEDLTQSCWIFCAVGDDDAPNDPAYAFFNPQSGLIGSVDQAVQRAGELQEKGMRDFALILPRGPGGLACLERVVRDVAPQLG